MSAGGIVRLLKWNEYPAAWDPARMSACRYGRPCIT